MATVESLEYSLDFNWDKKTVEQFNQSFKNVLSGFAKLTGAMTVAQGAMFGLAKNVASSNDELAKQSKRLNIASDDLQKLGFAAEIGGASTDTLASSLENLTKAQEDVLRGKGDLEAFGQLGINPADFENSNDLLMAISDSISTIQSDTEKINLLERIGVSRDLLQTLEGGSGSIKALGNEFADLGGVVTDEQKAIAERFQDTQTRLAAVFGGLKNQVGTALLEPFTETAEAFAKFARENMKEIIAAFKDLFSIVRRVSGVVFGILKRVFSLIMNIVDLMGGLENTVIAAGIAFGILKRKMLMAFAIPLAIGTALFLVVEDFVSFLQGKDSVIGDFFGMFGVTGEQVLKVFKAIGNAIGFVVDLVIKASSTIVDAFKPVVEFLGGIVDKVGEAVNAVSGLFGSDETTTAKPNIGGLINRSDIESGLSRGMSPDEVAKIIEQAGGAKALSPNVTINVNGATDPKSVVRAINQEMQRKNNAIFGGK